MLTLVDWIAERLDDPKPPVIDARIDDVRQRSARQPLGDYLKDTNQQVSGWRQEQLAQRGYVFNVELQIVGGLTHSFGLRWAMYQSDGERLKGRYYNREAGVVRPESEDHSRTWQVWVPYPPKATSYFVRFTLDDEKGQPVSEVESDTFRHKRRS